jgi:hypothetical protein
MHSAGDMEEEKKKKKKKKKTKKKNKKKTKKKKKKPFAQTFFFFFFFFFLSPPPRTDTSVEVTLSIPQARPGECGTGVPAVGTQCRGVHFERRGVIAACLERLPSEGQGVGVPGLRRKRRRGVLQRGAGLAQTQVRARPDVQRAEVARVRTQPHAAFCD